jgi:hypothetical protein
VRKIAADVDYLVVWFSGRIEVLNDIVDLLVASQLIGCRRIELHLLLATVNHFGGRQLWRLSA